MKRAARWLAFVILAFPWGILLMWLLTRVVAGR